MERCFSCLDLVSAFAFGASLVMWNQAGNHQISLSKLETHASQLCNLELVAAKAEREIAELKAKLNNESQPPTL
jgi:hypothetical protein